MPTRYSQLAYENVIVLNGGEHLSDMPGSFTRAQKADLVVGVRGNAIRVLKDRYGERCEISKAQFEDIKELDPEIIDVRITNA